MLCSPAFTNRACLALLLLSLLYFLGMDLLLYLRTQNYDVRPRTNNDTRQTGAAYHSPILCELDPICMVTVKALMLDHPNHFILSPLASLVDHLLGISHCWTWLSPNAISAFHVLVAVIGARFVTRSSLAYRRLGLLLFQVRAWLDNLDGHVARQRRNIEGERSDVGSIGYLVDGVADGLGCIALVVAVFFLLKRNTNRRAGYERLSASRKLIASSQRDNGGLSSKISFWNSPLYHVLLVGVHFLLTSAAWNRYISVYQDLLETDDRPPLVTKEQFYAKQTAVLRSPLFWAVALGWKMLNFHAVMDYMQLAIFLDRIWEYIRLVRWPAYVILLLLMFISELHYLHVYTYVQSIPPVTNVYTFLVNTLAAQ
ncbi:PREDICTED: ceramide phosphoethanolamine synthase [Dinoponera quadriceps]|uniref:Ceramide phosphoethanolamine synthase n=1 Tax=Dinoponera quadriceps TaxID=609295 RepID=A0A6P3X6I6_DINQU|nr:PREDICTED: ceramide phosphoethanolamine synthase [Dinoponera quadriceps]